ncbi:MAG TPA: ABC transporter ATP-binding protein [Jatrophihabitans sp.]|jgi:ABC-2 type transport system ATP-binding protein|nr:ABC transporter ATP-binding protein [Jatrophihabitans sp.]
MTTSTAPVLQLDGLTKRYGDRVVVDRLTVQIPRGAVAGFIGPNGAGKTTTMAMLLGLVRPTSGEGAVLGEPIQHPERYASRVGALLEGPALWPALSSVENLRVLARLGGHDERRIPEVLDLVGLGARGNDRFGRYSLGMKQRLGIAAALLGDPELLILDEPTNGLDPAGISDMRDLIARVAADGRTVLVSSHLLSELEQICDWLMIIEHGSLFYAGEAAAFGARTGNEILLAPADPVDLLTLAEVLAAAGHEAGSTGEELVVTVEGEDARAVAASLNRAAAGAGIVLAELHVRRPTLESTYLRMFEGEVA